MPRQKNFKKLVRTRAAKTGESYTAARAHFATPRPRVVADPDTAALTRILAATGRVDPNTEQPYTEALVFGVGGGIGFQYMVFDYEGWTSFSVEGRRNVLYFEKTGFIENALPQLGMTARVQQLPTPETAEKRIRQALDGRPAVLLTLDLANVPGHTVDGPYAPCPVTVAEDGDRVVVTGLPGGRTTMSWSDLVGARWTHAKKYGGLYQIARLVDPPELRNAVRHAITRTAECLTHPSRTRFDGNFGIGGMRKWATLLTDPKDPKGWPKLCPDETSLRRALDLVARGLVNGASRPLYAEFLTEAATLLEDDTLADAAEAYVDLGARWAELADLAARPGTAPAALAALLPDLADAEEAAANAIR
jgi:uncharacterized protein DUF4872/butirosin biosynthesis protein H-like